MSYQTGDRFDRYVLRRCVGEGGQGAVWQADDPLEPRAPKAIKLVSVVETPHADLERLRREARALARLHHPSLPRCHALVEDVEREHLGLVIDYVDGDSLLDVEADPRMSAAHREAALRHVAAALAYIHRERMVHRDLKLSNVLLSRAFWSEPTDPQSVKLVDFGIAVSQGNPRPLTQLGSAIGTLPYMPPEVIAPTYFDAEADAPASDVFAFGVVAWLLLSGSYPGGDGLQSCDDFARLYRAAAEGRSPWPRASLGHRWEELLHRCLSLEAARRPISTALMAGLSSGPVCATRQHEPPAAGSPGSVSPTANGVAARPVGPADQPTRQVGRAARAPERQPTQAVTRDHSVSAPAAPPHTAGGQRTILLTAGAVALAFVLAIAGYHVLDPSEEDEDVPVFDFDRSPKRTDRKSEPSALRPTPTAPTPTATAVQPGPEQAVLRYYHHLNRGEPEQAYKYWNKRDVRTYEAWKAEYADNARCARINNPLSIESNTGATATVQGDVCIDDVDELGVSRWVGAFVVVNVAGTWKIGDWRLVETKNACSESCELKN